MRLSAPMVLTIDPEYVAELRRRVEAAGVLKVAKKARMSRTTLWAALADRKPQDGNRARASYGAVERARLALAALDPDGEPMPPPFLPVGGPRSPTWKLARRGR